MTDTIPTTMTDLDLAKLGGELNANRRILLWDLCRHGEVYVRGASLRMARWLHQHNLATAPVKDPLANRFVIRCTPEAHLLRARECYVLRGILEHVLPKAPPATMIDGWNGAEWDIVHAWAQRESLIAQGQPLKSLPPPRVIVRWEEENHA